MFNRRDPGDKQNYSVMESGNNYSIRQDNETVLHGDKLSMNVIFNNMAGINIEDKEEYTKYKRFVKDQGFSLHKPFALWHNNTYIKTGHFKN